MKKWFACVIVALSAALPAIPVAAQAQRPPLKILVGFPAGGSTDAIARVLAQHLAPRLQRPVIVENKPGAAGAIAGTVLKAAPPNGDTLMLAAIVSISIYPNIAQPALYDPFRDFVPVAHVGSYDLALAVSAQSGVRDVKSMVQWMRDHPALANFGSPGTGSLPHLFGLQLASDAGLDMVHVPFQGAAPSLTALLGGQVGAVIQPVSDLLPLHAAGKLRILATTAGARKPALPDTPTFRELGLPGLEGGGWIGLFAPAGTPGDTIHALWHAVQEVEQEPAVANRLHDFGYDTRAMTPQEFGALTAQDAARWRKLAAVAAQSGK
jgi:tripartite-type tricarboxylate transporter receptor subunit TctC